MFVEAQRDALIQATEVAFDVKPVESPHDAIVAVRDRLRRRGILPHTAWLDAKQTADQLFQTTVQRLGQIARELTREVGDPAVVRTGEIPDQLRPLAGLRAGDTSALAEYQRMVKLIVSTGQGAVLLLSFHTIGPKFRGFIDVVAHLWLEGREPTPIKGGTFQINYEETPEAAQARFSPWLERVIVEGLMEWRRTL